MDLRNFKVEEKPEKVEEWWPPIERHLYYKPHNFHKKASVKEVVFLTLFPFAVVAAFIGEYLIINH